METALPLNVLIAIAIAIATVAPALHASEANREKAGANFLEADVDDDGALTRSEFRTLIDLNAADGIGQAHMVKRFGRYDQAFGRIDTNGDGLVTPEEMQAMVAQAKG